MKFVRFNERRLGILTADDAGVIDLTDRLGLSWPDPLKEYIIDDHDATPYVDEDRDHSMDDVVLEAPIKRPGKIVAAPGNYAEHIGEISSDLLDENERSTVDSLYYFLKAPSSITGPGSTIELPFSDRRFDHEVELAFVMGDDVKDVSPEEAWDNIFGYTVLLDISLRGKFDRSNRKSYDTFSPIGPVVVTPDELSDPQGLDMELRVNGEVRQSSNTELMINTCAEIVSYASINATVEAGDLITTGTPAGVGELADGDEVTGTIEEIGSLSLDVMEFDQQYDGKRL